MEVTNKLEKAESTAPKELAICVPTYNRWDAIKDMLDAEVIMLKKYKVDIYVYDSSEGNATKEVVADFAERGYTNLHYKRIDPEVHANEKVYTIYKDMEMSKYKYIWMIRDRFIISEEALLYIYKRLSLNIPIYWINLLKKEYGVHKINNINEFLMEASYELLRFGAVILNVPEFIKGSNWKYYEEKYINQKSIHASHVGYYFERCGELKNFGVCRIDLPKTSMKDEKTKQASWEHNRLQISAECWGSVIWGLPKCYTCKKYAMHSQDPDVLSKIVILRKKNEKNYGICEFVKYGKWFRRIRPENYWFYLGAALLPTEMVKKVFFSEFVRQIENPNRYIYGAGRVGEECGELLEMLGVIYKGYLVNNMERNPITKREHPVMAAREALCGEPVTIIIAVSMRGEDIRQIGENLIRMNGADTLQIIDYNKIRV